MSDSIRLAESRLALLVERCRGEMVLSVYLGPAAANPAERDAWQAALVNALAEIRVRMAAKPKAERDEFERAAAGLGDAVSGGYPAGHAEGWVAFITARGVEYAGPVRAPVATRARWQRGIWLVPCVRALKQQRMVVVTIIDSVSARFFRYVNDQLEPAGKVRVHVTGGHADHLGALPRSGFHPGTRGTSGADLISDARTAARMRVVHEAVEKIGALAGDHGYLIIGGTSPAANALLRKLPAALARHAIMATELAARTSTATIRDVAARRASALRNSGDRALIDRVMEDVGAHGAGVDGPVAVLDAVRGGRAQELLLTERFIRDDDDRANDAMTGALDHGTRIEVVTGDAAERLDRDAGGIAAHLRFVVRPEAPLVEVAG